MKLKPSLFRIGIPVFIMLLGMSLLLGQNAGSRGSFRIPYGRMHSRASEPVWFDAFRDCQRETEEERDELFRVENARWHGTLERKVEWGADSWIEPFPRNVPKGARIISSFIGEATRSFEGCRELMVSTPKIRWNSAESRRKAERVPFWYRAEFHRNACDLPPLRLNDISTWYARYKGGVTDAPTCELTFRAKGEVKWLVMTCSDTRYIFTETKRDCRRTVSLQSEGMSRRERRTFGWDPSEESDEEDGKSFDHSDQRKSEKSIGADSERLVDPLLLHSA